MNSEIRKSKPCVPFALLLLPGGIANAATDAASLQTCLDMKDKVPPAQALA